MSPVGAISVPFPPETGTNLFHPRPYQSLNGSAVLVCLVQNCYSATSATHTLVTCGFGDIDQDWLGGNVVSGDVVRG